MADDIDPKLIGQIISSIPYDQAFGAPLAAAIEAQTRAAKSALDFILAVGFTTEKDQDGREIRKTNYAEFQFERSSGAGVEKQSLRVPLILLVNIPQLEITEGEVSFDLEISQNATMKDHVAAEGELEGKVGWGPFSVRLKAKASYDKERTRSTDTRAKQHVLMRVGQAKPPEALSVLLDIMREAAMGPSAGVSPEKLIADTTGSLTSRSGAENAVVPQ